MSTHLDKIYERILNVLGYTQSKRRINNIFNEKDVTEERLNKLKSSLDDISCSIINALLYLTYNKHKKLYRSKNVALYSKLYNMNFLHRFYYKLKYKLPREVNILQEVFHHKCGLQFVDKKVLNYLKDKTTITAGAYYGDSPLVLHNITKGKVYGFEPNKCNFSLFQNIIIKNSKQDFIFPINLGLSDTTGFAYIDDAVASKASRLSNKVEGNKIEVTSIDDFIVKNNIIDLGLIHLDVEGLETKVIKGAQNVIKKYKPVLLISIYHNPQDFFDLKPLIESWGLNYTFKIRKLARNRFELMLIAVPQEYT